MHVTQRLAALRVRAGYPTRVDFCRALGIGTSTYQRYEDSTIYRRDFIPADKIEMFRPYLVGRGSPPITDADVDELGIVPRRDISTEKISPNDNNPPSVLTPPNAQFVGGASPHFARRIPLYGQAVGGVDGEFILNGNKIADVLAPASLEGVKGAYAVMVVGESMEPRYQAGEIVYVNPTVAIRKNDYVVVQIASIVEGDPPSAFIKRFVRLTGDKLVVSQLNPPKDLEFAADSVASIHRIIGSIEG